MIRVPAGVLVAGNVTLDSIAGPVDEVVFDRTVWVDEMVTSFGGNGANTSYALARLGVPVRLTGVAGDDEAGRRVCAELGAAGVDVQLGTCGLPTPRTIVIVRHGGARAFVHKPGASRESFREPLAFTPERIAGCSHFHLANPFAMPLMRPQAGATLERARGAGLTTSLDTGWDSKGEWMAVIGPCLPHLDVLFVNESEARQLAGLEVVGACAARFRERGARAVVIKLGAAGCRVFDDDGDLPVAGFAVHAVDSTGAGDCFVGAFLAGLHHGLDRAGAARLANAAGALSVASIGATTGLLAYDATREWIRGR